MDISGRGIRVKIDAAKLTSQAMKLIEKLL